MSRSVDANLIANQIIEAAGGRHKTWDKTSREVVQTQFDRLTMGLAEYERQQVAWLVNFRLSAPVL